MIKGLFYWALAVTLIITFPWNNAKAGAAEADRPDQVIEAAKKEGKILWYGSIDPSIANKIAESFRKKYPFLTMELYRTGDQNMFSRILAEAQAKKHMVDVITITDVIGETLKKKGLFAKYLSPERKFYGDGAKDSEGYWNDTYVDLNVVGYNTKLVPPQEVPKTWDDLLKPQWKGKMGMDTKPFIWFAYMLKNMGEKNGLAYMRKLADQDIKLRTGRTLNTQMMAAGEVAIGITLYASAVEIIKSKGASIDWVAIDPQRVIPSIHPMGIYAHAPHPNAARLFYDFVVSKEGQQIMADFNAVPSRPDVDPLIPRLKKGIKLVPFDSNVIDNYEKYVKLFREIFLKK